MRREMRTGREKSKDDDIVSPPDSMIDFPQESIKNRNVEQFILL
jgi:hypothetical protein